MMVMVIRECPIRICRQFLNCSSQIFLLISLISSMNTSISSPSPSIPLLTCLLDMAHQASQVALVVKNPPANSGDIGTWIRSPGGEDPLEESMATHSSILAWRIPWTEEPGRLWSIGSQRLRRDLVCSHTGN